MANARVVRQYPEKPALVKGVAVPHVVYVPAFFCMAATSRPVAVAVSGASSVYDTAEALPAMMYRMPSALVGGFP